MKILAAKRALKPASAIVPLLFAIAAPAQALANFAKPLQDVPDRLGTKVLAIDDDMSLIGLLGLVVVIGLLAVFYRRDKEQ